MNSKKLMKLVSVLGLSIMLLAGCSGKATQEIDTLQDKVSTLQEENETLKQEVETLQTQVETLTNENKELMSETESTSKNQYTLYTRDVDSWEIVEVEKLEVDQALGLKDKVQAISNQVSEKEFNGLPIEVEELKEVEGDTIAVISLNEDTSNQKSWFNDYFQGSAGGQITSTIVIETLLQRSLEGEWIDGVQLLYNGEEQLMEHMEFGAIIYR